jgi:hypothetical protein
MKQLSLFLIIALATVLTACEGPVGPAGRDGAANWKIQYYVVGDYSAKYPSGRWEHVGNGQYQCLFDVHDLTNFIYNEGLVTVSLMQNWDTGNEYQIGLPHVFFNSERTGDFTTAYTFDTAPGSIAFNVAYSDFANIPPPVCVFKVTLLW